MGSPQASGQQITLFYSGSVNVYDNVPADKARAIMLLLSDHCNSNTSVIDCGIPCLPTSSMPTRDNAQITQFVTKQHPISSKRSQAELPFARKASLARFLEKRKDRVLEAMKEKEDIGACAEGDVEGACKRMKH